VVQGKKVGVKKYKGIIIEAVPQQPQPMVQRRLLLLAVNQERKGRTAARKIGSSSRRRRQ
jgi:hypothetical protein